MSEKIIEDQPEISNIEGVEIKRHISSIYDSIEDNQLFLSNFIKMGINRNEKCIYITDKSNIFAIINILKSRGIDTKKYIKTGNLFILSKNQPFHKHSISSPNDMIKYLRRNSKQTKTLGYTGLCMIIEISGLLDAFNNSLKLLEEFEEKIDHIVNELPFTILCNYNKNKFPAKFLLNQFKIHSQIINNQLICHNFYYRTPDERLKPITHKEEFNFMMSNIVSRQYNINEKEKLKQERQRIQKFESIGVLAGSMAHDYNNILVSLVGNIELLKIQNTLTDGQIQIVKELFDSTVRARDITKQLLSFAKGGLPVTRIESLNSILSDINTVSPSFCQISYNTEELFINVNREQIIQAINNIIQNAVEATLEKGIIKIHVNKKVIQNHKHLNNGIYAEIAIEDDGFGIPEENFEKIFTPYFTNKQKKMGLGSATAYSIIQNHHGYITFSSKVNLGSKFFIYIPVTINEQIPTQAQDIDRPDITKTINVLLMDDEKQIHKTLIRILNKFNIQMESAYNGTEAISMYIKRFEKNKYDLVIMDLVVSNGMGGKEATEQIKNFDPLAKIIVSSGYSDDPVLANHKSYGFDNILEKPYSIKKLQEIIFATIDT